MVGFLVSFHIGELVKTTVTLETVDHLSFAVWGATTPQSEAKLRLIFCWEETISDSQ